MPTYDLIVAGGGPAGASAAWRAASAGARVLVLDKASFPRDKPCGDGLTPRAVHAVGLLGLDNELKRYNRVDHLRVNAAGRVLRFRWPASDAFPRHGYVIARTVFDELLLRHAAAAGAEVREGTPVRAPIVEDGIVRGVVARTERGDEEIRGRVVVAADGASSRLSRAVGMVRDPARPMGIAMRAHFASQRPPEDDDVIESYLELWDGDALLPGYGWIFPMGAGHINVGVGIMSTYDAWRQVNTAHLMDAFLRGLPPSWEVPSVESLRADGLLKGWRLPMGFAVRSPWRPGIMAVGDAAGVVNPFNGEGISEAIESGLMAAGTALDALDGPGGTADLSGYDRQLDEAWGAYYRLGRTFVRIIGRPKVMRGATWVGMRVPPVMELAFKVMANLYRERGGTAGDATTRGIMRLAEVIRLG